ncbi:hypothetical protein NQ315_015420 [Exocentrus adspersus]|uniref:Uncharacterized protein n=1 Tax=Exocentrus adspersus TaxID=1586481 RepID=A0AAV8VLL2_9CUCU|nr:hypothetical protein NQ315_015420 [Exocentrus adspersus]
MVSKLLFYALASLLFFQGLVADDDRSNCPNPDNAKTKVLHKLIHVPPKTVDDTLVTEKIQIPTYQKSITCLIFNECDTSTSSVAMITLGDITPEGAVLNVRSRTEQGLDIEVIAYTD